MNYKELPLEDLKSLYSDRPGFVFLSKQSSSKNSCEKLYKQLKDAGLSDYEPDFINVLEDGKFYAFVYPEGTRFKSALFYEYVQESAMMTMGMYKIDILTAFLKEN